MRPIRTTPTPKAATSGSELVPDRRPGERHGVGVDELGLGLGVGVAERDVQGRARKPATTATPSSDGVGEVVADAALPADGQRADDAVDRRLVGVGPRAR